MSGHRLTAISALDGRYANQLADLAPIVSESGLINYRIAVEAAWLLHLASLKSPIFSLPESIETTLKQWARGDIPAEAASQVKDIESTTNHDVKAVEYWIRNVLVAAGADQKICAFIHFACTSEDINNLAYAMMLKDLRDKIIAPIFDQIIGRLSENARRLKSLPMLSRTHGQTATPTTIGKEFAIFAWRLERQRKKLFEQEIFGKFNGAVGNFNAHLVAYPNLDWMSLSKEFVETRLGLTWNPLTTQIENHDSFVEFMNSLKHANSILLDFVRDMWGYIALGYFGQKAVKGEVGSSTMPHKINPIYFENAEGNLGIASSLLAHFADKLPISRWQRDLSDSTVLRSTGTAIGHSVLAWKSLLNGLDRIAVNETRIKEDLEAAWEVLAEPVQTVMRKYGVSDAYERLKQATRGEPVVTKDIIHRVIESCPELPPHVKLELKDLTPASYVGLAAELVTRFSP